MPSEPTSIYQICKKTRRSEGNVRTILMALLELGLVEKVEIHEEGKGSRPITVGWKKRLL